MISSAPSQVVSLLFAEVLDAGAGAGGAFSDFFAAVVGLPVFELCANAMGDAIRINARVIAIAFETVDPTFVAIIEAPFQTSFNATQQFYLIARKC